MRGSAGIPEPPEKSESSETPEHRQSAGRRDFRPSQNLDRSPDMLYQRVSKSSKLVPGTKLALGQPTSTELQFERDAERLEAKSSATRKVSPPWQVVDSKTSETTDEVSDSDRSEPISSQDPPSASSRSDNVAAGITPPSLPPVNYNEPRNSATKQAKAKVQAAADKPAVEAEGREGAEPAAMKAYDEETEAVAELGAREERLRKEANKSTLKASEKRSDSSAKPAPVPNSDSHGDPKTGAPSSQAVSRSDTKATVDHIGPEDPGSNAGEYTQRGISAVWPNILGCFNRPRGLLPLVPSLEVEVTIAVAFLDM